MNKKNQLMSVSFAAAFFLLFLSYHPALQAAEFPSKPITVIIPIEAGGDGDILTRPWMEKASALLGKPLIPVNKPGAGLTIGYREIYNAKPDGYTIGIANPTIVTARLQGFFPYDYRDFTFLGNFVSLYPVLLASKKTKEPFKNLNEAVSTAKAHPGKVSLATTAVGGIWWTAGVLLQKELGLDLNLVPQEGSATFVITQLAGGHMDLGITGASSSIPQIEAGNLQPIAAFGPERFKGKLQHVPTLKEAGYPVTIVSFLPVIGPPKMPQSVVATLTKTIKEAVNDKDYHKFVIARSDIPNYMPPDELFKFCENQRSIYTDIFSKAGLLKAK